MDNGGPTSRQSRGAFIESNFPRHDVSGPAIGASIGAAIGLFGSFKPIEDKFSKDEYNRPDFFEKIALTALINEESGYPVQANSVYSKLFDASSNFNDKQRAYIFEGLARTQILLNQPCVLKRPKLFRSVVHVAGVAMAAHADIDFEVFERAIDTCTLDKAHLSDVASLYASAETLAGSEEAEFANALLEEKMGRPQIASVRFFQIASSRRRADLCGFIVPFLRRNPELFKLHRTEWQKILKSGNVRFDLGYFEMLSGETLSTEEAASFDSLYAELSYRAYGLSLNSIDFLLSRCPAARRDCIVPMLTANWRDHNLFLSQFAPVLNSMAQSRWQNERLDFFTRFPLQSDTDAYDDCMTLAKYCADRHEKIPFIGQLKFALVSIQRLVTRGADPENQIKCFKDMLAAHPEYKPDTRPYLQQVVAIEKNAADEVRKNTCMQMAAKLNRTAFELEKRGAFDKAAELYQSALEVKLANLNSNDPDIAEEMIDQGRAEVGARHFEQAEKLFQRAIGIMRINRQSNPDGLRRALESYGQALNTMNQESRAEAAYGEARQLSRN